MLGPRVSDSVGVEWSLRICVPAKFPSDINATGLGPAPWTLGMVKPEHSFWGTLLPAPSLPPNPPLFLTGRSVDQLRWTIGVSDGLELWASM